MILLDVLPIDPDERYIRIKPVVKPVIQTVQDSLDTIRDTLGVTKDAVTDSAAQSQQLILDNVGTTEGGLSLLLPILVVCAALAGCLYLAYSYRKRHLANT